MPRTIEYEGRRIEVPDDFTDDDIAGVLATPAPAAPPPSVVTDVAKAAPTGLAKGVIGLAGLPNTVMQLADDYLLGPAAKAIVRATGRTPTSEQPGGDTRGSIASGFPSAAGMQKGVESVTGAFHKPETTAGEYAHTLFEFAPGMLIGPGGIVRKGIETGASAVASETAGQVTKGTALEPYARVAGAVAGNLGVGAVRARADAHDRVIRSAVPRGMTEEQWLASQRVADTSGRVGVEVTGAEAIQQGTGGATKLADVQRFVEGSPQSVALTEMMAARPGQMQAATGQMLDVVGPQSARPSTLGPRAAQAAEESIDEVRQGINAATRPDYEAAMPHVIDPADAAAFTQTPAYQAALRRLRQDEVLGPTFADSPDTSVAVIDAVTKEMNARGVALGNAANPGFSSQTAGLYSGGAAEARAIARDPARGGSQAYDDALMAQAQARQQNLEPLEQGPLGTISRVGATGAGTRSGTQAAGEAVLPSNPLVGGQDELVDAVTRLSARDPDLAAQLVRQRLADQADASMTRLVGGEAQGGGARFAKDIAGTAQQETNLGAVLDALERPGARAAAEDLIEVFRATGTRKPQGSPTDFNAQYRAEIGGRTGVQEFTTALRTGGRSLLSNAGDATRRAYLGRNNERLAETLAAPDSVQRIREIVARGGETPFVDALVRTLLQAQPAATSPGTGR